MTIATRNRFIRIAALISLFLVIMSVISVILILSRDLLPAKAPGYRPLPILDDFFLTPYNPIAAIVAIGIFPLFALAGLIYILVAFEKTQTVEISFFAACVFATSFEAIRLLIPLNELWIHANFFSVTISRIVFFSRIFTLLALLSSAIFATGKTIQHVGPSIFLLSFFSFSLANAIPINSENISSNFLIPSGYKEIIIFFFLLLAVLCALSYFILGKRKNIPEYSRAATGVVLSLIGYFLLCACDSWIFFAGGSILFFTGSWLYLKPIHQYYLWQ